MKNYIFFFFLAISTTLENTAFFGDILLHFPHIVHRILKTQQKWNSIVNWSLDLRRVLPSRCKNYFLKNWQLLPRFALYFHIIIIEILITFIDRIRLSKNSTIFFNKFTEFEEKIFKITYF